ncbi:hypothetical protein Xkoz_03465 [Xenorhabdus kozodoii]|uniref:Uncharacterized protein n=1 Tax=Xenorhabdus kozodoii TaxID=351676 RepID=A0A2D0L0R4_9GAMM|nr:hypothetical protein Xkoz_03465 [Xenorhabdus kozodoii]
MFCVHSLILPLDTLLFPANPLISAHTCGLCAGIIHSYSRHPLPTLLTRRRFIFLY